MKNYILLLGILLFTSCKTKEDYSKYTFIDEIIESKEYEIITLMKEEDILTNAYGYYIPQGRVFDENSDSEKTKRILEIPFILFNKNNLIYFTIESKKKNKNYLIEYNINNNNIDSLKDFSGEDYSIWLKDLEHFYQKQRFSFVNFKFPEAEEYYKVIKEEYYSEISEEKKNKILEEYKDSKEEIKQAVIETYSLRYTITYAELQMPKEKIHFKFNSDLKKKIEFFGNEELYKKGYMFIYIFYNLDMFPHSGGLYVIRPKTKK
ncbi:hypothetical protein [Apibacter adventoris]|uniref:hypothetical protein n=2 Tax=Apibacter adventoris TaxID=1679466 RepID=UPI000CF72CA0|nr:hypothetical protein [Apibacter adventoris]PQL94144.1 hypothetical protein C4S76_06345 [Apibacter adventoris]